MSESFDSLCWVVMCLLWLRCLRISGARVPIRKNLKPSWKDAVPKAPLDPFLHAFPDEKVQKRNLKNHHNPLVKQCPVLTERSELLTVPTTQSGSIFYSPNSFSHGGSYFEYTCFAKANANITIQWFISPLSLKNPSFRRRKKGSTSPRLLFSNVLVVPKCFGFSSSMYIHIHLFLFICKKYVVYIYILYYTYISGCIKIHVYANRFETNRGKSLIHFHAIWGLCWYNVFFQVGVSLTFCRKKDTHPDRKLPKTYSNPSRGGVVPGIINGMTWGPSRKVQSKHVAVM